jgi:hypothetical protein
MTCGCHSILALCQTTLDTTYKLGNGFHILANTTSIYSLVITTIVLTEQVVNYPQSSSEPRYQRIIRVTGIELLCTETSGTGEPRITRSFIRLFYLTVKAKYIP